MSWSMYVIYENPIDYPGFFVVRRHDIEPAIVRPAAQPLALTSTLAAARAAIPHGLICMKRASTDEPQIVETWM